jgi:hypothetical protein
MGFLHLPAPDHSSSPVPGLWNSPFVASCITADSPTIFGHRKNPAEAVQDRPWVPSIACSDSVSTCVPPVDAAALQLGIVHFHFAL